MEKEAKETINIIQDKLDYIGLDLNNIPEFLKKSEKLDFRTLKTYNDKLNKVYKYVDIDKIQILITPMDRIAELREKYEKAEPLTSCLDANYEEDIPKHKMFLEIVEKMSLKTVVDAEDEQEKLKKEVPFKIRFNENYLWQVYYSEFDDKYFMLVPASEFNYGPMFYVLKEQIKYNTEQDVEKGQIFVPVICMDYTNISIKNSEIRDLEKYLWTFTKEYPQIYEVFDKNEKSKLVIVGETFVYKNIKSNYKLELENGEESNKFFKLVKALYILKTELKYHFDFKTQIDEFNRLKFIYNGLEIKYDDLSSFLKIEYNEALKTIEKESKKYKNEKLDYEQLKIKYKKIEKEYIEKENEIRTYFDCKRTFFGRVKYFFKIRRKKIEKREDENFEVISKEKREEIINKVTFSDKKIFVTIEDIVLIYKDLNLQTTKLKNIELDKKAIEFKTINIESKLKNAVLYLDEIEKYKKNLFEFWKFTNKDQLKQLDNGKLEEKTLNNEVFRVFDYDNDFEDMGIRVDKLQRTKLSEEEKDAVFVSTNKKIFDCINMLYINTDDLKEKLDNKEYMANTLNEMIQEKSNLELEDVDVFGKLYEDKTKLNLVGNKTHREVEKDIYKVLNIKRTISIFDFKEILSSVVPTLESATTSIKSQFNMPIYILALKNNNINLEKGFNICTIKIDEFLEKFIEKNKNDKEFVLYRLNISEGMPLAYYSNIMFFENFNKTLPLGMNISNEVLINSDIYEFKKKKTEKTIVNTLPKEDLEKSKILSRKLEIFEYDLTLKSIEQKNKEKK